MRSSGTTDGVCAALRRRAATAIAASWLASILVACAPGGAGDRGAATSREAADTASRTAPKNLVWIVWDTTRRDRLGVYGHANETTPFTSEWAREGRIFDDCSSVAGTTVPTHASMFTGLTPSQHGIHNTNRHLPSSARTFAEILRESGFRTYLFSANPFISDDHGFAQGFDVAEHPWSERFREQADAIMDDRLAHLPDDDRWKSRARRDRTYQGAGELGGPAMLEWLDGGDAGRPFFAFFNYMDPHIPLLPRREARERVMSPEDVEASYDVHVTFREIWEHTFRVSSLEPEELRLTRLIYDAAIVEMDEYLRELVTGLEQRGLLDETIVVVTSDHGELLGEHHMMEHQFSVHQELIEVPLIVWNAPRLPAGRDASPVMNIDLFPTLLAELGHDPPPSAGARPLWDVEDGRVRISECPVPSLVVLRRMKAWHPDWDDTPWRRSLVAVVSGDDKLITSSNGERWLYDLADEPSESVDLADRQPERVREMLALLEGHREPFAGFHDDEVDAPEVSEEQRRRLESLGYAGGG